ncbi:MAG: hypothetical protein WCG99_02000 [Candidatus Berkelbacteria bacterium]
MSNFWKFFISIVVTFVIVGGGVFLLMQNQIDTIRSSHQTKMDDLNKQIAQFEPKTPVSEEVSLPAAAPVVIADTTNWKTYTNSTYGFNFKYPADWVVEIIKNTVADQVLGLILTSPEMQEAIKKETIDAASDIYFDEFTKTANFNLSTTVTNSDLYTKDSAVPTTVAGQNGFRAVFSGMVEQSVYFWDKDNYYFEATSTFLSSDNRLETILSTFQFTK